MDHEVVLPALHEHRSEDQPVRHGGPVPVLPVLLARGDGMRAQREEHPGITFRSMLEAQWSVIFDALCLPWVFEPVTFDLPSGLYVPDFKIYPEVNDERTFWVEIKGPWPNAREFEVATEVNIYAQTPLVILTGDTPRQPNGVRRGGSTRTMTRGPCCAPRKH